MECKKYYFEVIICLCGIGLVSLGAMQSFKMEPTLALIHWDILIGVGIIIALLSLWKLEEKIEKEEHKCQ